MRAFRRAAHAQKDTPLTESGKRVWRTLTKRERQVVRLLCADGGTAERMAAELGCKTGTVSHHLTKLYEKSGMDNRMGLIIFAFNHGLVMPAWAGVEPKHG